MSDDTVEARQRAFAEHMGVSWERYTARAASGVSTRGTGETWPPWYLRFAWRPADPPFARTNGNDYDDGKSEARDREHNARILASIPHTDPVPADDPLSLAVRQYGHEEMSVRFLSPFAVETRGTMQGYVPVFDGDGLPVMIDGGLMMCEIRTSKAEARAQFANDEAEEEAEPQWSEPGGYGDGDIFRVTWCAFGWRGVFALYRFSPYRSEEKKRGLELLTKRRGREPRSVRVGFYKATGMIATLSPEEIALVYREFHDHASFCRSSLTVETEAKTLIPMELGPGQLRLREAIRKQRARGVPVRLIYLKSRRIQATTGTAAEFFHDTAFDAGVHTAVLAHDATSTENIFKIYTRFHNTYRPFAGVIRMPRSTVLADQIAWEHAGDPESSFILVKTAGSTNFGRSFRLTNVHFSEFPYYEKPLETLSAVMAAVPKLPDTCAVIEGTAKTIGDTFHKMWQAACDPATASEWVGLFMGWWEHGTNRMPILDAERFGNSLTNDERELMGRFNLDFLQLAWRRWTIANDFVGDETRFKREHPATPEEAFTASSRNRFSVPHIQRMPVQRDPMQGELIAQLVGNEERIVFVPSQHGAVRIWKRPEKGRLYALGADCAQGLDVTEGDGQADPDFSVGQMLDRDTAEQVACLRARMMPGETGRYMALLGRYYNMAQLAGEINPGGGGVSMLEAVMNADYPRTLLYHRSMAADQDPQVRSDKLGWQTDGVSRALLISMLDELIRQDAIVVRDHITQQELLTFVIKKTGKAEHQAGCHDDCVIALALACVVILRMPRPIPSRTIAPPVMARYGVPAANPDDRRRGGTVRVR